MFDTPTEDLYVWLGLAAVAAATLTLTTGLPAAPPPDAAGLAATVDGVAGGVTPATATHAVAGAAVMLGPRTVGLRDGGATRTAAFGYGPVTPAGDGRLGRVAVGAAPEAVFRTPATLRAAAAAADERLGWRHAATVHVRRVSWGGVSVTVVTAR